MGNRSYLRIVAGSLKNVRRAISAEADTLQSAIKKMERENLPAAGDFNADSVRRMLERLTVIEEQVKGCIHDLEEIRGKVMDDDSDPLRAAYSNGRVQLYRKINDRLHIIEKQIKVDLVRLSKYCRWILDAGYIEDYEIEAEVSFYPDEDDPDFRGDDDNILATLTFDGKYELGRSETEFGLDDGVNHNIAHGRTDHPLRNEHHCWLFHCLYDHTELSWEEILRIGMVWVDINVKYQRFYATGEDLQRNS
jgi:hypothetical protein